jgi:hypothetical protein
MSYLGVGAGTADLRPPSFPGESLFLLSSALGGAGAGADSDAGCGVFADGDLDWLHELKRSSNPTANVIPVVFIFAFPSKCALPVVVTPTCRNNTAAQSRSLRLRAYTQ